MRTAICRLRHGLSLANLHSPSIQFDRVCFSTYRVLEIRKRRGGYASKRRPWLLDIVVDRLTRDIIKSQPPRLQTPGGAPGDAQKATAIKDNEPDDAERLFSTPGVELEQKTTLRDEDFITSSVAQIINPTVDIFNDETLRKQPQLWVAVFNHRLRHKGKEAVIPLWKKFMSYPIHQVPNIFRLAHVWQEIVRVAVQDIDLRETALEYIRNVFDKTSRRPPRGGKLYCQFVGLALNQDETTALRYHAWLKFLNPNQYQLGDLVIQAVADQRHHVLQRICAEHPSFKNMYGYIVPQLCSTGNFQAALSWHHFLASLSQFPTHSEHIQLLREKLSNKRQWYDAVRVKDDLRRGLADVEKAQTQAQEIESESRRTLSDATCARLLATRFFGIGPIVEGLAMLGVDALGPLAMRELLRRTIEGKTCNVETARQYFDKLKSAKISLPDSRFRQLVERLVYQGHGQLLHDLITSDLHSDAFEDNELQERLLAEYMRIHDQHAMNRTLEVLLFDVPKEDRSMELTNIYLRVALIRGDMFNFFRLLNYMLGTGVPVSRQTRKWIVRTFIMPRDSTYVSYSRLRIILRMWRNIALRGNIIFPDEWASLIELSSRINTLNMVHEFEGLIKWIVNFYFDGGYRKVLFAGRQRTDVAEYYNTISPGFWAVLLSNRVVSDVIRFYFRVAVVSPDFPAALSSTSDGDRIDELVSHPTLRGLRFLATFKDHGVPLSSSGVAIACIRSLVTVYSDSRLSEARDIKRRTRVRDLASIEEYVVAMEKIWGPSLWIRDETGMSIEKIVETIMLNAERVAIIRRQEYLDERRKAFLERKAKAIKGEELMTEEEFNAGYA